MRPLCLPPWAQVYVCVSALGPVGLDLRGHQEGPPVQSHRHIRVCPHTHLPCISVVPRNLRQGRLGSRVWKVRGLPRSWEETGRFSQEKQTSQPEGSLKSGY